MQVLILHVKMAYAFSVSMYLHNVEHHNAFTKSNFRENMVCGVIRLHSNYKLKNEINQF